MVHILLWVSGVVAVFFICGLVFIGAVAKKVLTTPAQPVDPNVTEMDIPATGEEQFSPSLLSGRAYRLTVTGTYRYETHGLFSSSEADADAAYDTDSKNNFTKPYEGFTVNGVVLRQMDSWREQRESHKYSSLLEGSGQSVAICLRVPRGHQPELRAYFAQGLTNPLIRSKLELLSRYRTAEFLQQTESAENRLMRFLTSEHLSRIFGLGSNALDFRKIMDQGTTLLMKVQPSKVLAADDGRLAGTLVLNEAFETALERPSGADPYYCWIDESAQFVSVEMAEAFERLRQKGFHLTCAFQHAGQFREDGVRLYKALKNIRNKIVFSVPDRQDALELADDLFVGLTEPKVKFLHRRLNHLVEDIRQTSTSRSNGTNASSGENRSNGRAIAESQGSASGRTGSSGQSLEQSQSRTRSFGQGWSRENALGLSRGSSQNESNSWGYMDTRSVSDAETNSSAITITTSKGTTASRARSKGIQASADDEVQYLTEGETTSQATTASESRARTTSTADTHTTGKSFSHSAQEMYGSSKSKTRNKTWSRGRSGNKTVAAATQRGETQSRSESHSQETNQSHSQTQSMSTGTSSERGRSQGVSVTDQPGTRHTAFWEEDPQHWTLEEQRWRASELLMSQPTGHWFIRTSSDQGFGTNPLPRPVYLLPKVTERLTRQFYEQHNVPYEKAGELLSERRKMISELMADLKGQAPSGKPGEAALDPAIASPRNGHSQAPSKGAGVWDRQQSFRKTARDPQVPARRGRRGPKPDRENQQRVAQIVGNYGDAWVDDDSIREICESLDKERLPVPKTWPLLRDHPARTWLRALEQHRDLVKKAIRYSCHKAEAAADKSESKLPPTSADS